MRTDAVFAVLLGLLLGEACLAGEECKIIPVTKSGAIGDPPMARLAAVNPGSDEVLITSANEKTSCRTNVENSTNQYATSDGKYFIFDSSSGSSIRMTVWDWARCKAQATLRSSSSFLVAGNKITANSYCDCPAPNAKHCTCYSAQVIRFGSDCTVSRDDKEAKNVTMKQTGVPFFGKAKIVNPGTPHATIVK